MGVFGDALAPFAGATKIVQAQIPLSTRNCDGDPKNLVTLQGSKEHLEWPQLLDLKASIDYRVFGEKTGGLYLGDRTIVFGWELLGVHVYDLKRTIATFYDGWVEGVRSGFPPHISWQIHVGTRWDSQSRTIELSQLLATCDNETIAQLICDEIATVQSMAEKHRRGERFIRLYCCYRGFSDRASEDENPIEGWIKAAYSLGGAIKSSFFNLHSAQRTQQLQDQFCNAYYRGYQATKNKLAGSWGMGAIPMSHDVLLKNLKGRFGNHSAQKSPHKITVTIEAEGVAIVEDIKGSQHISNWVASQSKIDLSHEGVLIQRYNPESEKTESDYIGMLEARDKFPGWEHEVHQCKGLWDIFAEDDLADLEMFVEISSSSVKAQRENARDSYRQAASRKKLAAEKGEYSESSSAGLGETAEILDSFFGSERPVRIAFALLVHAKSVAHLDQKCHEVVSRFRTADLQREYKIAGRLWLQTLPCNRDFMLTAKVKVAGMVDINVDFRHVYTGIQAIGILPFARTIPNDRTGIEFVGMDKQPVLLDLFSDLRQPHWAAIARQRVGKSNIANKVAVHGLSRGQPVTFIDMPPDGDGASALEDYCAVLNGSHVDCVEQSINLLGIPAALLLLSSGLSPRQREKRFKSIQEGWLEYLMILGGPTEDQAQLVQVTRELLKLAIDIYISNRDIQQRYHAAVVGGFGSPEWDETPTLADFIGFTKRHVLQDRLSDIDGPVDEALKYLDLRLSRKCDPNTIVGKAIARPSTVDIENTLLTVFSLKGLQLGSEEALAYCAGAYSIAIQKSLSHPISHVIVEEAQKAAEEPGVVRMMSDLITRYGKDGVRLGLVTNSFDKVAKSQAGRDLLDNITTKILGPITDASIRPLSETLNIPIDLVERCASAAFNTEKKDGKMHVLLCDNGRNTFATFHPGWLAIALSASNRSEREARLGFLEAIADRNVAIAAFSLYLRHCFDRSIEVRPLSVKQIMEFAKKCQFLEKLDDSLLLLPA